MVQTERREAAARKTEQKHGQTAKIMARHVHIQGVRAAAPGRVRRAG
jgi:hypothetical protein